MAIRIDFQFIKSGRWCNVHYPESPVIVKPPKVVPVIESGTEIYHTIEIIKSLLHTSNDFLDNPIRIINQIENLNLTKGKKSHYYRSLYLYMKKSFPNFRLKDLYKKYYEGRRLQYSLKDQHLIDRYRNSEDNASKLYKDKFFEYSRYY
jgi:hypothetical protein